MTSTAHDDANQATRSVTRLSVGVAVVPIFAGSDPTSGSVRAKAEILPALNSGSHFFFCSGVPKSFSGCGTPMLWCADSQTAVEPQWLATRAMARL